MKKVVFLIISVALVSFSTSCKEKPDTSQIVLSEINNSNPELAIAVTKKDENHQKYVDYTNYWLKKLGYEQRIDFKKSDIYKYHKFPYSILNKLLYLFDYIKTKA